MPPARFARLRHPAPWVLDLAIALILAAPVIGTAVTDSPDGDWLPATVAGVIALGAIFFRRAAPLPALLVVVAIGVAIPDGDPVVFPAMVVLYTIATRRPWPYPALPAAGVLGANIAGHLISAHPDHVDGSIGVAVECAAAVALGLYVGARRAFIDALRDRADRADRERELLSDRAVAQERLRIAQDLHDIVAHNVTLMVVGAQALGVTVDDDRVRTATDAIADLGRQAMTEMHRTLRLLRDHDNDAAARAPQPSLANLDKLIEQSRASGMDVELTVEGDPRPLSQTVELSAFRIVQEALTNVIKHAGRARTKVTVGYRPAGLELRITDNGHGHLPGPQHADDAARSGGHGVIGMRERAALFGGTLTALPRVDHGFEVTAVLPYEDSRA